MPGTEGLLHISEMRHSRVEKTEDVVRKGDMVKVKLVERDERGKMRLSMKALLPKPEGDAGAGEGAEEDAAESRPRREPVGAGAGEGEARRERPRRPRGRGRNGGR
jgi:polyribonucleotide nucleotidyltransferase